MRIGITGSRGLLGTALSQDLVEKGNTAEGIRRSPAAAESGLVWRPGGSPAALENFDVIFHLAGARVDRRWSAAVRREIVVSRVDFTRALSAAIAGLSRPPRRMICASAIGFYGDRGEEKMDESSLAGTGFFPELVTEWEAAATPARAAGVRVIHLRLGIVLSRRGGALARMLPLFRLGLGGPLGNGHQPMSWIHIEDAVRAMLRLMEAPDASGPYNITAPHPVSNRAFSQALGRALHRPARLSAPAFALRAVFGEMADAALLAGARVLPQRLLDAGFEFRYPDLQEALVNLVGA